MSLLDGVFDSVSFHVDGLISYLVDLAYDCLFALFYPGYALIKIVLGWIVFIWDSLYNFIYGFIDLGNSYIDFVYNLMFSWMPTPILSLIVIGLLISLAHWVYGYVKDVEIFGFKI